MGQMNDNKSTGAIGDLDNAQKIISCSDATLHLSTLFNNVSIMSDSIASDSNVEMDIGNLREEFDHLASILGNSVEISSASEEIRVEEY
jgi:hypothetical protein